MLSIEEIVSFDDAATTLFSYDVLRTEPLLQRQGGNRFLPLKTIWRHT